ncbi:unnamed protein product [Phytophthora fragariaefolia]|uniref:Unnamed protein product n=1 Tax=Phytophthora fragariaefolia TaxID=1490495 RepID=A0A9W6UE78_9STRA|nr:unnamed protein product [Phytophthora fragariaefolia]
MAHAAGTDGPFITAPLFTPILPPRIESVSHEALVKWKRDRKEYEAKLRARCRVTGEAYDAVALSICDSFDSELLDVFCELQLNVASADVTEGMLIAEIDHIVNSVKNNSLPDIKALFKKELRMKLDESDVNARIIEYYKKFNLIVSENGLTECFRGNNGRKEKCKRLISMLQPLSLKKMVKQCIRFTHANAASDPKELFRLILEKANELERQHLRLKQEKQEAANKGKEKPKAEASGKTKKRPTPPPNNSSSLAGPSRAKKDVKQSAAGKARLPPSPCPKCQEGQAQATR